MGLCQDIRDALDGVAAAVPDAVRTMRHGEFEQGQVVQSSSRDFADPVAPSAPSEAARFIANAADFPSLSEGAAVELDGSLRVVVSMKQDAVGATSTIGLSAEFEKCAAAYSGVRREAGAVRSLSLPLDVLVLETGEADAYSAAYAPSGDAAFLVAVRRDDWREATDPEPSDQIEVCPQAGCGAARSPVLCKVSTVTRHDGWFILKCRTKG